MEKRFLSKKAKHPPSGQTAGRADGPPGRWKKNNIRNKKKQEAERRKEEAERKNILKVRKQGGRKGSRKGGRQGRCPDRYIYFPLEIISIVRY